MRSGRSLSIAAVFAVSALAIGTTTVICRAQATASPPGGVQRRPSQAAEQSRPLGAASTSQARAAANANDAWREKWVKEYWAKEEERQRKLKEAKASSSPANSATRPDARQSPAASGGARQSSGGSLPEAPKSASLPSPAQTPRAQATVFPNHSDAAQKTAGPATAFSNSATRPGNNTTPPAGRPAGKPASAKTRELIGSEAKPDILNGPDIGKDHTIDSPLQMVGEGWKMVAYLVPTLAFILICLNLMRRYQQKTGRLPAGLRSAGRDFGRASQGIGSAFAGLMNFVRNSMSKPEPAQSIRLLESLTVGPSSIHLVQVRGRVLLLSAGAAGMTVLTEFQDDAEAASDEFRSLLQSAADDMEGLDRPGDEMPVSAVVGSLEDGMRDTAEAMARRLRRLRNVRESDNREF